MSGKNSGSLVLFSIMTPFVVPSLCIHVSTVTTGPFSPLLLRLGKTAPAQLDCMAIVPKAKGVKHHVRVKQRDFRHQEMV